MKTKIKLSLMKFKITKAIFGGAKFTEKPNNLILILKTPHLTMNQGGVFIGSLGMI